MLPATACICPARHATLLAIGSHEIPDCCVQGTGEVLTSELRAQVRGTQDVDLEFSDIKLAGQVCHPLLFQLRLCCCVMFSFSCCSFRALVTSVPHSYEYKATHDQSSSVLSDLSQPCGHC